MLVAAAVRKKRVGRNRCRVLRYPRNLSGDSRFIVDRRILEAITTSTAQNDSGLHELNFRDERYLPFEALAQSARGASSCPRHSGRSTTTPSLT